jgi:two-component system phosphate regulon response regulator PhoB
MTAPRVLVVEDEPDLCAVVEYNLRLAGFETEAVGSGFAALRAVAARRPDLVVLDIMLPDLPGTQVCRELKEGALTRAIPVLMLTAKGEEKDRVTGLEIGADDYVVKPVSMRELVLRVKAILRRPAGDARPAAPARPPAGEIVAVGVVQVDHAAHQASLDGKPLDLTPLEYRLLALLLERAGRAQSREALLEEVWQVRGDIETRTVDTHVKRLREKLGIAGDRLETVRGVGYRFRRDDDE